MARAKKAFVVTLLLLKNRRLTTKILTILKTNYNKNELIKLKESILNEDIEQMQSMMKLSTYRRSFFNKKKWGIAYEYEFS